MGAGALKAGTAEYSRATSVDHVVDDNGRSGSYPPQTISPCESGTRHSTGLALKALAQQSMTEVKTRVR